MKGQASWGSPEGLASSGTLTPAVDMAGPTLSAAPPPKLTKQHIRRLRFYSTTSRPSPHRDMTDLDLEVLGLISVDRSRESHYQRLTVTDQGRAAVYADRQACIAAQSPHHELGASLAAYLRREGRLAWENIEFKAEFGPNESCFVRPDVFSIKPTHDVTKLAPHVHEVKVSRADFLADVARPEKRRAYLHIAGSMTYVAIDGLIDPEEVPEGCGLLVQTSAGDFKQLRKIKAKKVQITSWGLMNLVLKSNNLMIG